MPNNEQSIPEALIWRTAWIHAPVGCAIVDGQGKFRAANDCLLEILGYTESELLDGETDFFSLLNPGDRKHATKEALRLFGVPGREGFGLVAGIVGKDGSDRHTLSARPIRAPDGQVLAMLVFFVPMDSPDVKMVERGGDVVVSAIVGFRDLYRDNPKGVWLWGVVLFALVKALDLSLFSSIIGMIKSMTISPAP